MPAAPDPPSAPAAAPARDLRRFSWDIPVLFVGLTALLSWASQGLGVTWDEAFYFHFSDSIRAWLGDAGASLDPDTVRNYWAYNRFTNPHPPLLKILSAITRAATAGWLPFPADYRLAAHLVNAFWLTAAYHLLRAAASRTAALAALGFVLLQPRVFGELLIATTDGGTAVTWLAITLIVWRIAESPPAQRAPLRLLLAAALATAAGVKFTGFMAIAPAGAYFLYRRQIRELAWLALLGAAALAFAALLSPDHWAAPWRAALDYLTYPLHRRDIPIPTYFLGRIYEQTPPWYYADVMALATVPVLLWPALAGLAMVPARLRSLTGAVLFPLAFWLLLVQLPVTPRHDGVRQFIAFFPLLGLLAWAGALGIWESGLLLRRVRRPALRVALAASIFLALPVSLARTHPYELSYYSLAVGGLKGAESLGLETSYYFDAIHADTLQFLNARMTPGQTLGLFPVCPDLLLRYQQEGLLRSDVRLIANPAEQRPDFLLLYRRRSMLFSDQRYLALPAQHEVTVDGVSLLKVLQAAH